MKNQNGQQSLGFPCKKTHLLFIDLKNYKSALCIVSNSIGNSFDETREDLFSYWCASRLCMAPEVGAVSIEVNGTDFTGGGGSIRQA